jgi:hypothetical protein
VIPSEEIKFISKERKHMRRADADVAIKNVIPKLKVSVFLKQFLQGKYINYNSINT